jgi:hypothetical protein
MTSPTAVAATVPDTLSRLLETDRRLSHLSPAARQAVIHAADPAKHTRFTESVRRTGGCANPIHLAGETATINTATGAVLHHYTTTEEPRGRLLVACGNRRASRCPSCSETYRADTYQLIRAGLVGGKGVPDTVREHPRVFTTLTAPSFGTVHNRPTRNGQSVPCRCGMRHDQDDPILGTPIDYCTYDYVGAVLWNAHTGALWAAFTRQVRREVAALAGLTQRELGDVARVSFGKVAEYQRRGLVHFHAVIRIDGPDGPHQPPPAWASVELLEAAIRAAAARVTVTGPDCEVIGERSFAWGEQVDVKPIKAFGSGEELTDGKVAGYVAKYATKSAADGCGTVDRPITCTHCRGAGLAPIWEPNDNHVLVLVDYLDTDCPRCGGTGLAEPIGALKTDPHARNMIRTCWYLGALPELAHLRLRKWAHMLGFRGHFSTKSRTYSTTLGELRGARRDYRAQQAAQAHGLTDLKEDTTLVLAHWRYAGHGYTPGEAMYADQIRHDITTSHHTARAALAQEGDPL